MVNLNFPPWVDLEQIGVVRIPDLANAHLTGQLGYEGEPSAAVESLLVVVDAQRCFIDYPKPDTGSLPVLGAREALTRILNLGYAVPKAFDLLLTEDAHNRRSPAIFTPEWFEIICEFDDTGGGVHYYPSDMLRDNTPVNPEWVNRGWIRARDYFVRDWTQYYVNELARLRRQPLVVWAKHGLDGVTGPTGNELDASIAEFQTYHAALHGYLPWTRYKGQALFSEQFSFLRLEVPYPGYTKLMNEDKRLHLRMMKYFRRIYCGFAGSHCVLGGVESDIELCLARGLARRAKDIYVLIDAIPSVHIPGVFDYTPQTMERYQELSRVYGINLVTTTEMIEILKRD